MIISLIGFMGCGKSSVGRRLSELLCCPFMDLDDVIAEAAGRSIPEIFASDGEAAFRRMELEVLCSLLEDMGHLGRSLRSPHHDASLVVPPLPCRGWHGPRLPHTLPIDHNQSTVSMGTNIHRADTPDNQGCTVLALGGGTVMTPECAEMVREKTLCIYLRASVDTLISHLEGESSGRPMLHANTPLRARIEDLMSLRSATYEKTAHIIIDTDGRSIETVAQDILSHIKRSSTV